MINITNNPAPTGATKAVEIKPLRQPVLTFKDLNVNPIHIFSFQSKEGETTIMMNEILSQLAKIPSVEVSKDEYGNLYATKGKLGKDETYPSFVCHTDTVHKIFKDKYIYETRYGDLFAMTYDGGVEQIGIGGDDFCGIICCLELLWRLKKVKCAFFLDEEGGCKGSDKGELSFFDNCRYAIQIDRKGNSDIITNGNGTQLCSLEFENALNVLGDVYGYSSTTGRRSDVIKLKTRGLGISACNLSAGYYDEHTKKEYVNKRDLLNVLEFCIAISKDKKVYPHKYEAPAVVKTTAYNNSRYTSYNNTPKRTCKECNSVSLSCDEGVVCAKCLRELWEEYTLKINSETGQRTLVVHSYINKDEDDIREYEKANLNFGPCDHCTFCAKVVFDMREQERGFCDECANCSICGKVLLFRDEIKDRKCMEHLGVKYCKESDCNNVLHTELEIMQDMCSDCHGLLFLTSKFDISEYDEDVAKMYGI